MKSNEIRIRIEMVKLFALSVFYKSSNEATLLNAAYDLGNFSFFQRNSIKEILGFAGKTVIEHTELACRQSVKQDEYVCHVLMRADKLGAVLISDDEYPQRVAHTLLTKVLDDFITQVPTELLPSVTESSINFPPLTTYLAKYQDPRESDAISKIQTDLEETKIVLKQSIDAVLERGVKLDKLIEISDELCNDTKTFYRTAKKTNSCCSLS